MQKSNYLIKINVSNYVCETYQIVKG